MLVVGRRARQRPARSRHQRRGVVGEAFEGVADEVGALHAGRARGSAAQGGDGQVHADRPQEHRRLVHDGVQCPFLPRHLLLRRALCRDVHEHSQ